MPPVTPNLEAILDQTLEVVWLWDPAGRRPVYVNRAFARVWGRPTEAVLQAPEVLDDDAICEPQRFSQTYQPLFIIARPDDQIFCVRTYLQHAR